MAEDYEWNWPSSPGEGQPGQWIEAFPGSLITAKPLKMTSYLPEMISYRFRGVGDFSPCYT